MTRSLGPFLSHAPITVLVRSQDSLPSISNTFTEKFTTLFSKFILGAYKVCICLKTVEKKYLLYLQLDVLF